MAAAAAGVDGHTGAGGGAALSLLSLAPAVAVADSKAMPSGTAHDSSAVAPASASVSPLASTALVDSFVPDASFPPHVMSAAEALCCRVLGALLAGEPHAQSQSTDVVPPPAAMAKRLGAVRRFLSPAAPLSAIGFVPPDGHTRAPVPAHALWLKLLNAAATQRAPLLCAALHLPDARLRAALHCTLTALRRHGLQLNVLYGGYDTVLTAAATHSVPCAHALLDLPPPRGLDVDVPDVSGHSALRNAVVMRHADTTLLTRLALRSSARTLNGGAAAELAQAAAPAATTAHDGDTAKATAARSAATARSRSVVPAHLQHHPLLTLLEMLATTDDERVVPLAPALATLRALLHAAVHARDDGAGTGMRLCHLTPHLASLRAAAATKSARCAAAFAQAEAEVARSVARVRAYRDAVSHALRDDGVVVSATTTSALPAVLVALIEAYALPPTY